MRHRIHGVQRSVMAMVTDDGSGQGSRQSTRWFAVEEIDVRGRLRSATTFPASKEALTGAENLLEQWWQDIEGPSAVLEA